MTTISPSKLRLYLECPSAYWWQYINPATRGRQVVRPYFSLGNAVHGTLKFFFQIKPEYRSKDKLMALFASQWSQYSGRRGGFRTANEEADYRQRGQLMLSGFYEREDIGAVPLWASDKVVKAKVGPELEFNGKLDRVDELAEGLHVIDYKTSREEREDEWQLPMYAVMARAHFNRPVVKLSYHFLETGSWVESPANPAREAATVQKVAAIVAAMPASQSPEYWLCPDGDDCRHCDYLAELGIDAKVDILPMN